MDVSRSLNLLIVKKYYTRIVISLLALGLFAFIIPTFAAGTGATPRGTYSNYFLPSGTTKVEFSMKIETLPDGKNFFYSNQFGIENGDGGYIGLQAKGSRVNGTTGETAVFSIFNSGIAATPSQNCSVESKDKNFDGYVGAEGTSCRIPFDVKENVLYKLTVEHIGNTYVGTIRDTSTNVLTTVASIQVYSTWGNFKPFITMWTEYFGSLPSTCEGLPYSKVRFYAPKPNLSSASFYENRYSTGGTCTNSNTYADGTNGNVQEMGGTTNPVVVTTTLPPPTTYVNTTKATTTTIKPTTTTTKPIVTTTLPPTTKGPVVTTVTTRPPIVDPVVPMAPSNITYSKDACFLFWCNITIRWTGSSDPNISYVLNAGGTTNVVKTKYISYPLVVQGNTYNVSIYSVNTANVKSSITNVKVSL